MSNMSYCRFQNTDRDLSDCQDVLEELFHGDHGPLSSEELIAAKRLVERCMDIIQLVGDQRSIDLGDERAFTDLEESRDEILDEANHLAEAQREDE